MKKLVLTALIAVSIVSSSFASDVKVNRRITSAFQQEYNGAENVEWKAQPEFVKATFVLDNRQITAFYKANGERIGTTTSITGDQLPTFAKRIFAKKYAGYTVKEAIQFENSDELSYFLTAVRNNEELILQVKDGTITTFRK